MNLEAVLKSTKAIEVSVVDQKYGELNLHTLIDKGFSYSDNCFSIMAPRYNGKNYPLHHGETIEIFFVTTEKNEKKVHSFKGTIVKKTREASLVEHVVKKTSEVKEIQRREAFRLPITKSAIIYIDDEALEVLSKNISATGIRFVVSKKLYINAIVKVKLSFDEEFSITTEGKVIESKIQKDSQYKYDTRIMFIGLEPSEKDRLVNYIFSKQIEMLKKTPNSDAADKIYHKIYGDYKEKRQDDDVVIKTINFFSIFSWVMLFLIIVFFIKASPETSYGIGRFFDSDYLNQWNTNTLNITLALSVFQIFITGFGLSLNTTRLKRDSDSVHMSLVFNLIIAIIVSFFILII
jgi:c-di-GMP-binding flagellar brake protein YcgR